MATLHYTARVKDSRTLELPEEAQTLGLRPGDEIHIFVSQNETDLSDTLSSEEEQERFRILTAQLFADADATKRLPGTYNDPQKAGIADRIAEKHRKMGLQV